jgi:hypothetical protein
MPIEWALVVPWITRENILLMFLVYKWRSSMLSYAPYFKMWRCSQLPFINLGAKQCCHLAVKIWTKEKRAGKIHGTTSAHSIGLLPVYVELIRAVWADNRDRPLLFWRNENLVQNQLFALTRLNIYKINCLNLSNGTSSSAEKGNMI